MNTILPSPPSISPIKPIRDYQLADWYQERIHIQRDQFVEQLKDDETYTTRVVLQNGETIWPRAIGYHNPNMLVINGLDINGNEVVVLTPHTSTQVIFTAIKKEGQPQPEKEPLGFYIRQPSEDVDPSSDQSYPADFIIG